eukprot:7437874-Alexandrium_andersonii.AAC.1
MRITAHAHRAHTRKHSHCTPDMHRSRCTPAKWAQVGPSPGLCAQKCVGEDTDRRIESVRESANAPRRNPDDRSRCALRACRVHDGKCKFRA